MMATNTTTNGAPGSSPPPPPAATLPPPLQPRIPRAPIRIIVLCDGTAQARNWVKTSLSTSTATTSSQHRTSSNDANRNDAGFANKRNKPPSSTSTASAETGDFFTNVALLAKCISQSSGVASTSPPASPSIGASNGGAGGVMPQIVFYQSGVGTGTGHLQNLFDQGTGLSLGSKIEEAYSFIVDNYQPGDELFFFGFSRGAYTARCITGFINWCGILSKVEMTHFADIWAAYQRRDPDNVETDTEAAQVLYAATQRYPSVESEGVATSMYLFNLQRNAQLSEERRKELVEARRAECAQRRRKMTVVPPQIKVVGVWDTVSALGFPGMFQDNAMVEFFDFYDPGLGSTVQFAFHALSLEEDRKDFLPTLWYQPSTSATPSAAAAATGSMTAQGKHQRSKQLLKQTWFQGVHTDVGGGYQYHGLSDLTLIWMVSQLVDPHTLPDGSTTLRPLLNLDLALLATILDRRREWGMQPPHRSRPTVNYQHYRTVNQRSWDSEVMKRTVWANMAKTGRTNESIHPSVVRGGRIRPETHPAFDEMRKDDPKRLERMWAVAEDWEQELRPTEKLLYWNRRGPYPWIPSVGDAYLNPLLAPLVVSGGWNIPEFRGRRAREVLIDAATAGDVDDSGATTSTESAGDGDVDDQPSQGWEESSSAITPPPQQTCPLIPSKELGENPIDPCTHPHLHALWQTLYSFSSTPNALLANLINLRLVPKANLNQTALQRWIWDLGDRFAGYAEGVKDEALVSGLKGAAGGAGGGERVKVKKARRGKGKGSGGKVEDGVGEGERHDEL